MGRPSKLTDAQWVQMFRTRDVVGLARYLLPVRNTEEASVKVLRLHLFSGNLHRVLGTPRVTGHRFEFPVPGGRIDLLLFHADGSVSIVEAKAAGPVGLIAAGIGQLALYSALLPGVLWRQQPTTIRRILVATCEPDIAAVLMRACQQAGAEFRCLAPFSAVQEQFQTLVCA